MSAQPVSEALRDQAAHWFVLLASGEASEGERQQWQAWRQASTAHEAAWQLAQSAVGRFAALPRALAASSVGILSDRGKQRRRMLKQLVLLCGVGVLALGGYRAGLQMDWTADAVTAVGEQRTLTLADGSRMVLDTDSAVDIDFTATQRTIRLRRGQIMIETAPDTAPRHRDFLVETQEGRTRALGTRFTVLQEAGVTHVAVLEARVALQPVRASQEVGIAAAGESVRFDRDRILQSAALRPEEASWPSGVLVVNEMRLDEFTAHLARYSAAPLRCNPEVAALKISGAFPLASTERVLEALGRTLPVKVAHGKQGALIGPR
jgi:transmembrane sensor